MKGYRKPLPVAAAVAESELNTFQLQSRQNSDYLFHMIGVDERKVNAEAAEIV